MNPAVLMQSGARSRVTTALRVTVVLLGLTMWCEKVATAAPGQMSNSDAGRTVAIETLNQLATRFEANVAQVDDQVEFISRGHGFVLFLKRAEAVLIPNGSPTDRVSPPVRMRFEGGNPI